MMIAMTIADVESKSGEELYDTFLVKKNRSKEVKGCLLNQILKSLIANKHAAPELGSKVAGTNTDMKKQREIFQNLSHDGFVALYANDLDDKLGLIVTQPQLTLWVHLALPSLVRHL